jgi:hypothetical protein
MKFPGNEKHETRQRNNGAYDQQEFSQVSHRTILADESGGLTPTANTGPAILFAC